MSIFKCKICGGSLEIDGAQSVATCEYCGTKQTLPKLDDERRANLYDRANHFRRNNDFDKAMGIYENILNEDNTESEAYWSIVLCRYGIEYVEDPKTRTRVPTVNRAQFTSIFDDEDYKSAIANADSYQREIYEAEANTINEIQKGILAISEKEEPFDVFICYKETDNNGRRTQDSVLATELYQELTREGFKVFFSRITLEDKLGVAYEPYIFAALHSAKVMVVLGTRAEYFNAVWVKNEWSRYLALIKGGAKKILVPAYRDMDPYDLPEEFSHLQAQDMAKLGFMQDLTRGIKKIVKPDAPKVQVKETVVQAAPELNVAPLLKRTFMFLEDGEFDRADELCEQVLNQDPENARAYLGKLMAELHVKAQSDLANCPNAFDGSKNYQKAVKFADTSLSSELIGYVEAIKERNAKKRKEAMYLEAMDNYKSYEIVCIKRAIEAFESLGDYKDSRERIRLCQEKIARRKKRNRIILIVLSVLAAAAIVFGCVYYFAIYPNSLKNSNDFEDYVTYINEFSDGHFDIPDGVTEIPSSAFKWCHKLKSITIPDSVTSIGSDAFYGCDSLTSVTIGNGVTTIGGRAFQNCPSLTSITITDRVTSIGSYAFRGCTSLTSVTIGNGVTTIGDSAFSGCIGLTNVTIPDSVTSIGSSMLSGCSSLESIVLPFVGGSKNATTASPSMLFGYIFGKSSYTGGVSTTQYYSSSYSARYYIPSSLKSVTVTGGNILYGAFRGCTGLTSVTIGNGVTSIGDYAFYDCSGLTSVTIGNSVTSIGDFAFYSCTALEEINFNATAMNDLNYNNYVFYNAGKNGNGIKVVIGKNVTKIPAYLFYPDSSYYSYAPKIVSVEFEDGSVCKSIGYYAFFCCPSLTSVTIPDSVTSIGDDAFNGCTSLMSVNYLGTIEQWCNISFGEVVSNPVYYANNLYINGELVTDLVIPESVTSIGSYAFSGCSSLTSVTIPDSVAIIGEEAFLGCTSLTSVYITDIAKWCGISFGSSSSNPLDYAHNLYLNGELVTKLEIPDSVTSIGSYAFWDCTSLASVIIGNGVTSIGDLAFGYCSRLTSIKYRGTQSEWKAISKGSRWDYNTGSYTITYNYTGE